MRKIAFGAAVMLCLNGCLSDPSSPLTGVTAGEQSVAAAADSIHSYIVVFRNSAPRAICQSELCANYDHKHQELSARDPDKGLNKMAIDIGRSFFRRMAAEGIKLDAGLFDTVLSAYMRQAEDTLRFYAADAALNGLKYPRHEEENAVATFVRSIHTATKAFQEDPLWTPLISNWNRVESACPHFLDELRDLVRSDNE